MTYQGEHVRPEIWGQMLSSLGESLPAPPVPVDLHEFRACELHPGVLNNQKNRAGDSVCDKCWDQGVLTVVKLK